jgi:hypothetical protein
MCGRYSPASDWPTGGLDQNYAVTATDSAVGFRYDFRCTLTWHLNTTFRVNDEQ